MKEVPKEWSKLWILMWLVNSLIVIISAFIVPPRIWAAIATALFGIPEVISLVRKGDRYPPLTYVSAYFLPRWLVVTLIGTLTGAVGAMWLGIDDGWLIAFLLGLFAWGQDHYDVTYSSKGKWLSR